MKNITIKRTEKDEQFEEDIIQLADERQKKTGVLTILEDTEHGEEKYVK